MQVTLAVERMDFPVQIERISFIGPRCACSIGSMLLFLCLNAVPVCDSAHIDVMCRMCTEQHLERYAYYKIDQNALQTSLAGCTGSCDADITAELDRQRLRCVCWFGVSLLIQHKCMYRFKLALFFSCMDLTGQCRQL